MVKLNKNKVFYNSNQDFSQFKKKRKFYILNAALLLENNLVEKKLIHRVLIQKIHSFIIGMSTPIGFVDLLYRISDIGYNRRLPISMTNNKRFRIPDGTSEIIVHDIVKTSLIMCF